MLTESNKLSTTVICFEAPVRHGTFTTVAFRFFLLSKGALDLAGASLWKELHPLTLYD